QIAAILPSVRGTRGVFAERTNQGYFLDFVWRRADLARYGISMKQAEDVLSSAIGGENVTTVYQGSARYPVNVRYMRDFRSSRDQLAHILIQSPTGSQIPVDQLAAIQVVTGPAITP